MGLFFTLLYILTAYLAPQTIFGSLAEYHVEIVIAVLALVTSVVTPGESLISKMPESYAVIGLAFAVCVSLMASGWFGGAPAALLGFLPNALTFFMVVANCRKKIHLQWIILVLLFASFFTIAQGYLALRAGDTLSPYLLSMGNDEHLALYRIRGLSFINDPNDLSQLLVSLIPCLFLFWSSKNKVQNVFLVFFPSILLIFGMYLTHSRGAMLALIAMVIVAARRKIGLVPSLVAAVVLFAAFTAAGWSGGREVSVEAGADRIDAWSTGILLIRSHPLFGVGFNRFTDFHEITAHNSVVVCAAELGLFGFFFWVVYTLGSIRDAVTLGEIQGEKKVGDEERASYHASYAAPSSAKDALALLDKPISSLVQPDQFSVSVGTQSFSGENLASHSFSAAELAQMGRILTAAFAGFLVAGWFLSRAYAMTLFLYGGMTQVLYRAALARGVVVPRMPVGRLMRLSGMLAIALLIVVYVIVRVQHFLPH